MTVQEADPATHPLRAALWMIGVIVSFTVMAVAGREASVGLDTFEILMYRSAVGIAIVLSVAGIVGTLGQVTTRRFGLQFLRNVFHFTGQNLWFWAIAIAPFAQVVALEFTSPLWVMLAAPFFLGERMTWLRGFCALLGFAGVLLVARPGFQDVDPALIAAFLSAIGFGGAMLCTKLLTRTESVTCILFWLVVLQFIFGLVCVGYDGDIAAPTSQTLPWLILVSISGLSAHFALTKALSLAPATIVAPIDFFRLPTVAIVGAVLYREAIDLPTVIGALLIFGANYLNIWRETKT